MNIRPQAGYFITEMPDEKPQITEGGLIAGNPSDEDFVVQATVIASSSEQVEKGQTVLVSIIEARPFSLAHDARYYVIHERDILGYVE